MGRAAALAKRRVWDGLQTRTPSGLVKSDLMLNRQGLVVSRRKHAAGVKQMARMQAAGVAAPRFTTGRVVRRKARPVLLDPAMPMMV